jgi:L-seryl-tRNA(Ser) seleniumtransferase
MANNSLKNIPSMDILLNDSRIQEMFDRLSRGEIKMELQTILEGLRRDILSKSIEPEADLMEIVMDRLEKRIRQGQSSTLRPVINATGVVIHTNLGRSLLARQAIEAIEAISGGYCSLEYDLEEGRRGSRYVHCESLLKSLTGAEAALVVNNNAAAVTLVINTFSVGKDAIVSRGELVEIGGAFRMPDIMAKSGANMLEVGTTNKTRMTDYRQALSLETGILVKVHRSNFSMSGFVDEVGIEDLAELGRENSIPLLYDQGSGLMVDLSGYGFEVEPVVQESVRQNASMVCFSGDKLLGGPQAGCIVGKKEYIDSVRVNPLTRTYRVDKFTLAALEATLRLYLEPEKAFHEIPVLRMLTMSPADLEERAKSITSALDKDARSLVSIQETASEVGGGSMPAAVIPSVALCITPGKEKINDLERTAREWETPIIGRIHKDRFLLDLRTVGEDEDRIIVSFLERTCSKMG